MRKKINNNKFKVAAIEPANINTKSLNYWFEGHLRERGLKY